MRKLAPDEAALWKRVVETVKPIHAKPLPLRGGGGGAADERAAISQGTDSTSGKLPALPSQPPITRAGLPHPKGEGLDSSWDRRLARGLVSPDSTIDLHGHSLASAYDRLDHGLASAIARGARVLLLITGRPPAPESERPYARGAIRAAVGDWLKASRHADRIATVRNAHPRHGGAGALYIVLRRNALRARKS